MPVRQPALFVGFSRHHWRGDLTGGLTAAVVALPLALAFGNAALGPGGAIYGLYGAIITGFLEAGEDPLECAKRETLEELNLHVTESSLIGVYAFPQQNQVIIAYHVRAVGEVKLNQELDDYKVVPIDELQGWNMGTGLAINDWLASVRAEKP